MKKILILLTTGLLLLSACTPANSVTSTGPGVETIVASTLQAMTAAAPSPAAAKPSGLPVSYNNISFTIPLELNASAAVSTSTDVEYPYINPSGGPMAEHVVFDLTNYPVPGKARIMVFKSSEYAAYGEPVQGAVTALLAGQDATQPFPKALVQGFYAQAKPVPFQNGHGLRFLTEVLTGFAPITNKEIFYYYQGITNDGAYFVAAVLPVNASFLVADDKKDSPTPPDGIPFNWGADLDFTKYLTQITQKLNDAAPENYSLSLLLLDKMIGSMQVANP
jgi:hypothetical protein